MKGRYFWEFAFPPRFFRERAPPQKKPWLELALQLNPDSSVGHQWYAGLLVATGRYEEATGKPFARAIWPALTAPERVRWPDSHEGTEVG